MRLLLDTANLDDVKRFAQNDAIAGVTTNPSLVAREQRANYFSLLRSIADVLGPSPHLSVEVITLDPDIMLKQADSLHELIPCAAIKVPVLPETLRVITRLHDMKIAVNATACFTALQAKIAEDAGADFVSFFFNRMIDAKSGQSNPREHALAEISTYKHRFCRQAKVICGSIREPLDIQDCWANGADFVTASAKVIDRAVTHVKTTESVQQFQKDIEAWLA